MTWTLGLLKRIGVNDKCVKMALCRNINTLSYN